MNNIQKWQDENKCYNFEGDSGVRNLCKLLKGTLGYEDRFMPSFSDGSSVGSLTAFLADNPGAIFAMMEWIEENNKVLNIEECEECWNCGEEDCEGCDEQDEG